MKLYELRAEYEALQRAAFESDDTARFEDTLTGLRGEIVDKLHACCVVVRGLTAEAEAFAAEMERMKARRDSLESRADRLRAYMTVEMALLEMKSVRTPLFSITLQANKPKLVVTNETALTAPFWRSVPKLDNQAVRDAIERGEKVDGAHLEPSQSVRIR